MTETKGHFTGGFQLVNGWNNVEDNNSGKTMGFVGNITTKKITWNNNYYTGPENPGTNTGWRNLYDTTVLFTPADKFNAYVNFDYGQNKSGSGADEVDRQVVWRRFRRQAPDERQERDHAALSNGSRIGTDSRRASGVRSLKEFTFTYEYKWTQGLLARLEYRRDWSRPAVL